MVLDFRLGTRVALIKYLGQNKKVTSYILHFVGNFSNTFQVGLLSFYKQRHFMWIQLLQSDN